MWERRFGNLEHCHDVLLRAATEFPDLTAIAYQVSIQWWRLWGLLHRLSPSYQMCLLLVDTIPADVRVWRVEVKASQLVLSTVLIITTSSLIGTLIPYRLNQYSIIIINRYPSGFTLLIYLLWVAPIRPSWLGSSSRDGMLPPLLGLVRVMPFFLLLEVGLAK